MIKKLKFNGRITHKGTFCQCTRNIYNGKELANKTTERLDNTEYKALLYSLMVEEEKQVDELYVNRSYTVAGYVITSIIQINRGHKTEYTFDKFNIDAMS